MSRDRAQTVTKRKFGLMLALLAALAVIATLGSQWENSRGSSPASPSTGIAPSGLSLPAAPAQADTPFLPVSTTAQTTVYSLVDVSDFIQRFERQVFVTSPENDRTTVSALQVTTASPDLVGMTTTSNNPGLHPIFGAWLGSIVNMTSSYITEEANARYALAGGQAYNSQVVAVNGSVFESPAFTPLCSSCVASISTTKAAGAITPTGSLAASIQAVTEGVLGPLAVLGLAVLVLVLGCMLIPAQRYGLAPSLSALVVKGRISKRFGAPMLPFPV